MNYAAFLRSPIAHRGIEGIDVSEAKTMPGVLGDLTGRRACHRPFHDFVVFNEACARPSPAVGKVCFVGEAVAIVVLAYRPHSAAADPEAAHGPDAPLQFEELGPNRAASSRDPAENDRF